MFELGRLFPGKAAQLGGMQKLSFMEEMGRKWNPVDEILQALLFQDPLNLVHGAVHGRHGFIERL